MNSKKQPPEVFYKIAVLKNFSILTGKYLCSSLFLIKFAPLQISNFLKKRFQRRCFSVNIAKFLKKLILKKICERLLLNNVKGNYSSMKIVWSVSQHLQENTFTEATFLINSSCRMQFKPIFIKKEVPTLVFSWCFIKSTDHRPTDHRPLTHRPTDPPTTDPPTHWPNDHI